MAVELPGEGRHRRFAIVADRAQDHLHIARDTSASLSRRASTNSSKAAANPGSCVSRGSCGFLLGHGAAEGLDQRHDLRSRLHRGAVDDQREVTSSITSTSTSPFSFSVRPDDTRSTIRGARPRVGASSIAPFSLTHSACTPRAAKWRLVICGYLVATRTWLHPRGSSLLRHRGGFGDRDTAMADLQVDRRVKLGIAEFGQHIRSDDAQLRRAMRDEGGDVEGAYADQLDAGDIGGEAQRAAVLVGEGRFGPDAGGGEQRQRLARMRPLGTAMISGWAMRIGDLTPTSGIAILILPATRRGTATKRW